MRCQVIKLFTLRGEPQFPGSFIDVPEDKFSNLAEYVQAVDDPDLWGWFVLEVDRIYRSSSSKSADRWELHKEHRKVANALYKSGDIPAARVELEKALVVLRSESPAGRVPSTTSAYCDAYDGYCSVKVTGVYPDDCILMKCEHYDKGSPARTCYNCKSTDFWQSAVTENHYVCRKCYPPAPGAELLSPDQPGSR